MVERIENGQDDPEQECQSRNVDVEQHLGRWLMSHHQSFLRSGRCDRDVAAADKTT